jgi:hypothetical protein
VLPRYLLSIVLVGACSPPDAPPTCADEPVVDTDPAPYMPAVPPYREFGLVADPYSLIGGRDCDCNAPMGTDPCFVPESCGCWCLSEGSDLSPALVAALRSSY